MTQAITIDQIIAEKVKALPLERQQQVLDFVDFLYSRISKIELTAQAEEDVSFLEATREFAGCLEGEPSDLSINKKYLEGLSRR